MEVIIRVTVNHVQFEILLAVLVLSKVIGKTTVYQLERIVFDENSLFVVNNDNHITDQLHMPQKVLVKLNAYVQT